MDHGRAAEDARDRTAFVLRGDSKLDDPMKDVPTLVDLRESLFGRMREAADLLRAASLGQVAPLSDRAHRQAAVAAVASPPRASAALPSKSATIAIVDAIVARLTLLAEADWFSAAQKTKCHENVLAFLRELNFTLDASAGAAMVMLVILFHLLRFARYRELISWDPNSPSLPDEWRQSQEEFVNHHINHNLGILKGILPTRDVTVERRDDLNLRALAGDVDAKVVHTIAAVALHGLAQCDESEANESYEKCAQWQQVWLVRMPRNADWFVQGCSCPFGKNIFIFLPAGTHDAAEQLQRIAMHELAHNFVRWVRAAKMGNHDVDFVTGELDDAAQPQLVINPFDLLAELGQRATGLTASEMAKLRSTWTPAAFVRVEAGWFFDARAGSDAARAEVLTAFAYPQRCNNALSPFSGWPAKRLVFML